jgi:predicted O-methyltransferase YrrM
MNFTNNWFDSVAKPIWDQILPQINPSRILEIGSYEGASVCYLIDAVGRLKDIEIHCVDSWGGGVEHEDINMSEVEDRFVQNTRDAMGRSHNKIELAVHKGRSDLVLSSLLSSGKVGYFDFIYIDGSHQAPDVLCDALLGFRLLREGGVMVFDDYLWQEQLEGGVDLIRCPKIAIDSFTNIYSRKIRIISVPLYQIFIQKICD